MRRNLFTMRPEDAATRLFTRVMTLAESGNSVQAPTFVRMAIDAGAVAPVAGSSRRIGSTPSARCRSRRLRGAGLLVRGSIHRRHALRQDVEQLIVRPKVDRLYHLLLRRCIQERAIVDMV